MWLVNVLPRAQQIAVIAALAEGGSIRGVERLTGVHRDTIMRLLLRVGDGCAQMHDALIRDIPARRVQCDEVWTFVFKKDHRLNGHDNHQERGSQYVFVGLDAETKLVISYLLGKRGRDTALYFMRDLRARVRGRVHLTTDGYPPYIEAVAEAFGDEVDYAQLHKIPAAQRAGTGAPDWYYPPRHIVAAMPARVYGRPTPRFISTSFVERQNLTLRHQVRRFTRLTPAFSKALPNLAAAVALHYAKYNWVLECRTLGKTPAMAAGLASAPWSMNYLIGEALEWVRPGKLVTDN